MLVDGSAGKSGSVPCEETILFVNVAAIAAKMSGFPCVVSAAKKIGNGSVYSNEFCVPGKPIKTYAAEAARIQQLREKSVFPCVVLSQHASCKVKFFLPCKPTNPFRLFCQTRAAKFPFFSVQQPAYP